MADKSLKRIKAEAIVETYIKTDGNKFETARKLQLSERIVRLWLSKKDGVIKKEFPDLWQKVLDKQYPEEKSIKTTAKYMPHDNETYMGMPSNEERLYHLDFYTKKDDAAPIVKGGNKRRGDRGTRRICDLVYAEEHSVELYEFMKEGITRKD